MLTVEMSDGARAQIVFSHREVERLTENGTETTDQTAAMLVDVNGYLIPGTTVGFAHRNPQDGYNAWEGREKSLKRAVATLDWPSILTVARAFTFAKERARMAEARKQEALNQITDLLDLADEIRADLDLAEEALLDGQAALACR